MPLRAALLLTLLLTLLPAAARPAAPPLTARLAGELAALALRCIDREFPNKPELYLDSGADLRPTRLDHPIFFGCYDWHSAVHGHWMLLRLLRLHPAMERAGEIRAQLQARFTPERFTAEARYFERQSRRAFERPYGWAWVLRLLTELRAVEGQKGRDWRAAAAPLEAVVLSRLRQYLPKLTYPIRVGTHANTAFALGQALDYAEGSGDAALGDLLRQRSRAFYLADRAAAISFEPSGEDFFSPVLSEADLMRRVLPPEDFARWLGGLLPGLPSKDAVRWLTPATVSDPSDSKLVHLDGLNLTRAWMLRAVARALPSSDPRRRPLEQAAETHAAAGLARVFSGRYEGEHWLASFAVYERSEVGEVDEGRR